MSSPLAVPFLAGVLSNATLGPGPMIFDLQLRFALGALGSGFSVLWSQARGVGVIPWVSLRLLTS